MKFWESGDRQIKGRDIIKLAEHFGVSSDFILEISPIKSFDASVRAACEVTGLSETVVESLAMYASRQDTNNESHCVSAIMEQGSFWSAIARISSMVECVHELEELDAKIKSGDADDTAAKSLLDLCREIRMHRFEAAEALTSAVDEAGMYSRMTKIIGSYDQDGRVVNNGERG